VLLQWVVENAKYQESHDVFHGLGVYRTRAKFWMIIGFLVLVVFANDSCSVLQTKQDSTPLRFLSRVSHLAVMIAHSGSVLFPYISGRSQCRF